jgi:hypothetical protein
MPDDLEAITPVVNMLTPSVLDGDEGALEDLGEKFRRVIASHVGVVGSWLTELLSGDNSLSIDKI